MSGAVTQKPLKRVGGVMLLRKDGALLMQHRDEKPLLPYPGLWSIPSGKLEPGESIEACASRELYEETGYKCDKLTKILTYRSKPEDSDDYELTVFGCLYDGIQTPECHEGQAIRFIERQEIQNYPVLDFLIPIWDRALKEFFYDQPKN